MQGTMEYMARNADSRHDVRAWYPEAKTVLICAFSYAGGEPQATPAGHGRFARYSVLGDYHDRLKAILTNVLTYCKQELPGCDGRLFVDTSPLLERLYGRYAGLGWVGKNTMLISPKIGSYHLLAGLALNQTLKWDGPEADHCGSCTKCLDACPTDAFPKERVLDASKCVAYFTIEHRGTIPEGFRAGVGDWVMGCDVCQEVCPWNRFAKANPVFERLIPDSLPLEELAQDEPAAFKKRFGKTPVTRAKRRGILRNALLAMGNSGDRRFRAALERWASDSDAVIAEQARWSLSRLKT
jgi:epoxyqueuosine reductase